MAAGLWTIFFFHGCNHYVLCSAVAVWYFNHETKHEPGAPFGDSLHRLMRFNIGSVALTSLVNGLFFVVKILAHIFSFDTKEEDHFLVSCCLKCLNCLFCIFRV